MTLTQTLRGMAQYLSATADPIDRERWAMTLRDTADALATAQAERDAAMNAHAGALGRIQDYILAVDAAAKQRDAALAEREHERLRYDGMRSDRDDWRKRCEDEQAAHALTADRYVGANRRGDELRAALTEARRLLQSALPHVGRIWHGSDAPPPVYIEELRARIAAVLAQEEK